MGEPVTTRVTVREDAAAVAREAADRIVRAASEAIAARGRFTLVLAGGSTPKAMYRVLAASPGRIDWARAHVLFGDERCVNASHADSNYRMASESLLAHVAIEPSHIHRIRGEAGPVAGAAEYDREVREVLSTDSQFHLDVALLGMGGDGHTASLFPGRDFAADHGRLAAGAVAPPESPVSDRITLTLDCFVHSRSVMFLVTGGDKRTMLARVLKAAETGGDPAIPASMVRGDSGVDWIIDRDAASD